MICLNKITRKPKLFKKYKPVSICPCKHEFHTYCIVRWIASGNETCPICRAPCQIDSIVTKPRFNNCLKPGCFRNNSVSPSSPREWRTPLAISIDNMNAQARERNNTTNTRVRNAWQQYNDIM